MVDSFFKHFVQCHTLVQSCHYYDHLFVYKQRKKATETSTTLHNTRKGLTSSASITVPTPTVTARVGTFEISPPKKRELATMVSYASVWVEGCKQ